MKPIFLTLLTLALVTIACGQYVTPTPILSPVPTLSSLPVPEKPALGKTPNALVEDLLTAEVTAYQSVHVRAEPGTDALRIGYLYHGDTVTLTGTCSDDPPGWAEITFKGEPAWVNADYLSDNSCKE